MHVWEITIHIEGEYSEVSGLETQEQYHTFINEILYGYDTHYQVEQHEDKIVLHFLASTPELLQEIIHRHTQLFQDAPARDTPLNIEFRIYEY